MARGFLALLLEGFRSIGGPFCFEAGLVFGPLEDHFVLKNDRLAPLLQDNRESRWA